MSKLVFLGGTCGDNNWREGFMAELVNRGVNADYLFNPVVEHWDEAAQRNEEEKKAAATHLLFYIASPGGEGGNVSFYSGIEAVMALYDKPEGTVVVFNTAGMAKHTTKAMNQSSKVLKARFPNANIFATPGEALEWLTKELVEVEQVPA